MPRPIEKLTLAITAAGIACGLEPPVRPDVDAVRVTASRDTPLTSLGESVELTANAYDADGFRIPGIAFTFTSSDPSVAIVDERGIVTAVANGSARIRATAQGKSDEHGVTVSQVAARVVVSPSALRVPAGETPIFHAEAVDARGNPLDSRLGPVWSTTTADVAIIGADGRAAVPSRAPAGATVRAVATFGSISSTSGGSMIVDPTAVYAETVVATVTGGPNYSALNETKLLQFSGRNPRLGDVTFLPGFAEGCTWSSSAPDVLSFDVGVRLVAHRNGRATLTVTCNGVSGSIDVTVAQSVATLSVLTASGAASLSSESFRDVVQLVATATDPGGVPIADARFAWSSDAPEVAPVDSNGVLTTAGNGTAHIFARAIGTDATNSLPGFTVEVRQVLRSVFVEPRFVTVVCCGTVQFTAVATDANRTPVPGAPPPVWSLTSFENPDAATVDQNGLVTTKAPALGVTIFASVGSISGSANLRIQ